jgi:Flp pilus assembly protein TadG
VNPIPLRKEAGTALVEFALVLPLFLVLLLGMVDFGKGLNYWIDQTHLANQAARFATVDRNPGAGDGRTLQDYIRGEANTGELAFGDTQSVADPLVVCITFPEGNTATDPVKAGDPVTVEIKTTYDWLPFLDANMGVAAVDITGSATMRLEAKPTSFSPDDNSEDC